ncbi:ribonuclease H-like domain-containing protein [Tanacetum coccineum]
MTQTVSTKSGKINTAGVSVNTALRPVNTASSKPTVNHPRPISNACKKGYSQVTRPFNKDRAVVSENKRIRANAVKASACWSNPQQKEYKEKEVIDSDCSRHMTKNKCYLTEYEDYDGGFVSFGDGKGRSSRKGKIKTGTLDFDNVNFCKELKYNLFSVSQICDKKNNVLFTNTECLVLSSDFKLLDESQVLLRVPRKDNIYSVDLKSVVPTKDLTCLFATATIDESNLWHRRLGHINFKNMNKLVKGNLVRGKMCKKGGCFGLSQQAGSAAAINQQHRLRSLNPKKLYCACPLRVQAFDSTWSMGLAGYYRRFIEGFSKITKSMTKLTQKKVKFDWGDKQEAAFQLLNEKLCAVYTSEWPISSLSRHYDPHPNLYPPPHEDPTLI